MSKRQRELLERVCLKRYRVVFHHYMGSFHDSESVSVESDAAAADNSFRASTVAALRDRELIILRKDGPGTSVVVPTRAGLDAFIAQRRKQVAS